MRHATLDQVARAVVESDAAPAVACAAGFRAKNGWHFGVGAAGTLWPTSPAPVTADTVFDLASLTKPVFAVAAATESVTGRLAWQMTLQDLLPELHGTWAGSATLERLLSHRAGLVPHKELYRRLQMGRSLSLTQLLRAAANANNGDARTPSSTTRAVYSDLGYLLVGAAIERRSEIPLDRWLSELLPTLIKDKLGSVRAWLSCDSGFRLRCAPTEVVPWRGGLVWGRVHDENAWTLGGHGLCGHAGLFGTAIGVANFGATVLDALADRSTVVPREAARLTTQEHPGGTLCAGFDRKSTVGSTAGCSASSEAFGHLGFTGTSLWCDPSRALVVVVLTNRVCPARDNAIFKALRPKLHDSLFEWAEAQRVGRLA